MHPRSPYCQLAAVLAALVLVTACASGSGGAADNVDDSASVPGSALGPASTTRVNNNGTADRTSVGPAATSAPTASLYFAAEGPNVGTWITTDRAGKSASGGRVRSHSDLLYAPPFEKPSTVYSTPNATPKVSDFITSLSVSADGRTAYFGETTTELATLPFRCSMRLMVVEQGSSPRQVAEGDNPTIAPDSAQLAFMSGTGGSCQLTQLHVLDLRRGARRDFDVAAFVALLPRSPDKVEFAQFTTAYWSADSRWLAVGFNIQNGWAATAIVDTTDGRLQLVRPDDDLRSLTTTILGVTGDFTTLQTEAVAWTANGAVALRVTCSACAAGVYAIARPDSAAQAADEPKLAADTPAAFSPWLGLFNEWILVSDVNGIVARSDSKSVLLFPLDGFTANAAWPAGQRTLPVAR